MGVIGKLSAVNVRAPVTAVEEGRTTGGLIVTIADQFLGEFVELAQMLPGADKVVRAGRDCGVNWRAGRR